MNAESEQEWLEQRRMISLSDSMILYALRESRKKTSHSHSFLELARAAWVSAKAALRRAFSASIL